jgi:hypothetical protein
MTKVTVLLFPPSPLAPPACTSAFTVPVPPCLQSLGWPCTGKPSPRVYMAQIWGSSRVFGMRIASGLWAQGRTACPSSVYGPVGASDVATTTSLFVCQVPRSQSLIISAAYMTYVAGWPCE